MEKIKVRYNGIKYINIKVFGINISLNYMINISENLYGRCNNKRTIEKNK